MKRDEPERGEGARITHANRGHCNEYLCAASWPAAHAAAAAMLRCELLFFDVLLLNSLTQSTKAAANQTTVGPGCNYLVQRHLPPQITQTDGLHATIIKSCRAHLAQS